MEGEVAVRLRTCGSVGCMSPPHLNARDTIPAPLSNPSPHSPHFKPPPRPPCQEQRHTHTCFIARPMLSTVCSPLSALNAASATAGFLYQGSGSGRVKVSKGMSISMSMSMSNSRVPVSRQRQRQSQGQHKHQHQYEHELQHEQQQSSCVKAAASTRTASTSVASKIVEATGKKKQQEQQ